MKTALDLYAEEMGLSVTTLTLESLIDSHRELRKRRLEFTEERLKHFHEARERGYQVGLEYAQKNGCISREALKKMSLENLMEFLAD